MESSRELLIRGLTELEIDPAEPLITAFTFYLDELKKWNRAYNLTSLREDRDIIIKHFFDSLLFLRVLPVGTTSVADVGSGAGFPGLPLALVRPELDVTLIEPSRKKSAFLRHMGRRLGTGNTEVLESRTEDVRGLRFDCILTRALFSIAELAKRASHLLQTGGCFILSKGPKVEAEVRALPQRLVAQTTTLSLPASDEQRILVVVRARVGEV